MKLKEMKFWFVLSAICLALAVVCVLFPSSRFGTMFFGVLFIGCFGEFLMIKLSDKYKLCKSVAMLGRVLFCIFVASFVIIQGFIISGEYTDDEAYSADYVLVLGAKINGDKPSAALKSRLDKAVEFSKQNEKAVFIVCGGQGNGEIMTEAELMEDYLLDKGIDKARILKEDKSKNTIQNIKYAKQLYNLENYKTAVITNEFHLARARKLMERAGLEGYGIPAPTPYIGVRIVSHLREYGSTLGLVLTGRYF